MDRKATKYLSENGNTSANLKPTNQPWSIELGEKCG